jgi:hypothetical protein
MFKSVACNKISLPKCNLSPWNYSTVISIMAGPTKNKNLFGVFGSNSLENNLNHRQAVETERTSSVFQHDLEAKRQLSFCPCYMAINIVKAKLQQ